MYYLELLFFTKTRMDSKPCMKYVILFVQIWFYFEIFQFWGGKKILKAHLLFLFSILEIVRSIPV